MIFLLLSWAFVIGEIARADSPSLAAKPSLPAKPSLSAPLILETVTLGDAWLYLEGPGAPGINTENLRTALKETLTPTAYAELERITQARASFAELESAGIHLEFDEKLLVINAKLEEGLRARRSITVRPSLTRERDTVNPAPFSGYLNGTATQGFEYPRARSRAPFRGNLGLASNYKGLVLESGATYAEQAEQQWYREDTRLVRDFESALLRVSVGDIPVLGAGYQGSRPLGGVSVTRQYSIQPYLNIRPLNRTEILVKRPSVIEVYVNDGFVNRVNAPPGPLSLSDFPLFSGVNKVDLKVTDDTGAVEWVNLNMLYDTQLLGRGIQQFSYHVGAPAEAFRHDRRYDDRNLTTSLFHRFGLTDHLTLGGSYQGDRKSWLLGQDFVLLARGGLFSGESGYSHVSGGIANGGVANSAARVRYRSLDYKLGADKPLRGSAEIEYKGRYFAALGQAGTFNDFSWKYDLSGSKPLTAVTSAGVTLQYMLNRIGKSDRRSARLDFTSEIAPQWRTSLSYTAEREERLGHRFQVVLTWLEEAGKFYGNLSYDYPSKTARLEANRSPSAFVGDVRATVGAQNSPETAQGDALLEYTHEKANLRFEQVSNYRREASGARSKKHSSVFTAATAVAWAGGAVGWTRPINDSFLILKAKPRYREFEIPVNRVENSAEATVNKYGPGVVPTLTSYNETPIVLDPSNLPLGYSLSKEFILARPTYRSGILVDLGGDARVIVTGKLQRPGGAPLSLATGEARLGNSVASSFFTNREGLFFVENLAPGEYDLAVDGYDPFKLKIQENQAGYLRLDPITLKGTP